MNLESDNFIKYFSENRNEYHDPKIILENGILSLVNMGFDKWNLAGNVILILLVPIVITLLLLSKQMPSSTAIFLIGFATVWLFITLNKWIQKILANNTVMVDLESKLITVVPQDYLRKNILKIKERHFSFNSIRSIKTKSRNYDKFNSGLRLILSHKDNEVNLIDIWTKQLGAELSHYIQKLISDNKNYSNLRFPSHNP